MYKKLLLGLVAIISMATCKKENGGTPQVSPIQGTINADWGDTVVIAGKNLPSTTTVFFGENFSTVVSNNGSEIRCVVPFFNNQSTISVYVKYNNQSIELTNYLTLNAPVITSFTPTQAIGDTITILGNHFQSPGMQVKFGDAEAKIISVAKRVLKVIVPESLKTIHTTISILSQLQTATSASNFEVLKPVITSVTPEGFIGDKMNIIGKHFHPLVPYQLFLDGEVAYYQIDQNGLMTFQLPYKLYPRRKTTLKLKLLDYEVTYPIDITIKNNWVEVSEGVPFSAYYANPITIGQNVYVVAPKKNAINPQMYLWRFNQADFSWISVGNPITFVTGNFSTGTNGSKLYLYSNEGPDTFYEGDPTTGIWTAKANFIGPERRNPAMFSIGGKIYVGAGMRYVGNQSQSIDDWYAYTPGTNKWSRIADMRTGYELDYPMTRAQTQVINNIAYVVCGGWFYDYKYNPASNQWTPMQNMLEPRIQAGVVTYKQKMYTLKGYVVQNVGNSNRDIFSYNPTTDQWQYEQFDVDPYDVELNIGFVSGGKIYMLSYDDSDTVNRLYEALSLP